MSKYTYPLPLRWADADSHGHVNNALFLRYTEEARTRMFQDILPTDEAGRRRHAYVVSQSLVDYQAPLLYREAPRRISEAELDFFARYRCTEE